MHTTIQIRPSTFAITYQRFQHCVESHKDSPGPFQDFQSGLAYDWEHYKEWLYLEARRLLEVHTWKKKWVGSGKILERVVAAIIIHQDKHHRNNIVEWQGRFGPESKSHSKLLEAQNAKKLLPPIEKTLWEMYAEPSDPQACFEAMMELFGKNYDLISYLFFIRDWNEFMPVKPTFFPKVFAMLGVPLEMRARCTWENYSEALARLREVQRHLAGYDIPGGVRLIDAHSFCWMLGSLAEVPTKTKRVFKIV